MKLTSMFQLVTFKLVDFSYSILSAPFLQNWQKLDLNSSYLKGRRVGTWFSPPLGKGRRRGLDLIATRKRERVDVYVMMDGEFIHSYPYILPYMFLDYTLASLPVGENNKDLLPIYLKSWPSKQLMFFTIIHNLECHL